MSRPIKVGGLFAGYGGLKALGNGVVPQQAAEAIRWLTATVRDRLEEAA